MSEPTDTPKANEPLGDFLARHQATGEPPAEAIARVRAKLLARAATAGTDEARAPAPPRRRFPVAPELLAVAALIVVLLVARALVGTWTQPDPAARGPQVEAVVDAYRAGDLAGAQRLASQHCTEAACGGLRTALATALGLSKRLDNLSAAELAQLEQADLAVTGGGDSVLARRIAEQRARLDAPPDRKKAEALFEQGQAAWKARREDAALPLLQACLRADPAFHPCYRVLASTWARIAARDQDAQALEQARLAYERFLEVAPPDDEYVPKVRAILAAAEPPSSAPVAPAPQREAWRTRARDLYLRGYQLKDTQPEEAAKLFQAVVDLLPADDEWAQKARTRLDELRAPP